MPILLLWVKCEIARRNAFLMWEILKACCGLESRRSHTWSLHAKEIPNMTLMLRDQAVQHWIDACFDISNKAKQCQNAPYVRSQYTFGKQHVCEWLTLTRMWKRAQKQQNEGGETLFMHFISGFRTACKVLIHYNLKKLRISPKENV